MAVAPFIKHLLNDVHADYCVGARGCTPGATVGEVERVRRQGHCGPGARRCCRFPQPGRGPLLLACGADQDGCAVKVQAGPGAPPIRLRCFGFGVPWWS